METNTTETEKLPVFSTTTALAEEAHGLIHDACFLIANGSAHSAEVLLAKADGLLHDLCNNEAEGQEGKTRSVNPPSPIVIDPNSVHPVFLPILEMMSGGSLKTLGE